MQAIINATRIAKATNNAILTDLCNMIDIEKRKRNLTLSDRNPDKLVSRLAEGIRNVCPQITHHMITNEYRKRKKFGIFYNPTTNTNGHADAAGTDVIPTPVTPPTTSTDGRAGTDIIPAPVTPPRTKGGQPVG